MSEDGIAESPSPRSPGLSRRVFMHGSAAVAAAAALLPHRGGLWGTPAEPVSPSHPGSAEEQAAAGAAYVCGAATASKGAASDTVTVHVTHATLPGDAIVVFAATTAGNTLSGAAPITDTKKNTYAPVTSETNGAITGWAYVCLKPKTPLTTSDSIYVAYNSNAAHNVTAIGVPGAAAVDSAVAASGTSATPTVTTGTLTSQTGDTVVAMATNGDGSGTIRWNSTPFAPVGLDGGGTITMVALDASAGAMVAGGDVEGYFVTGDTGGSQYGDTWTVANTGVNGKYWRQCACVALSVMPADPPGTFYSCCGDATYGGGGFLVSTDGGSSWLMRSAATAGFGFAGNDPDFSTAPKLPNGGGWPRSTGNLLAQDPVGGFLYAATYAGGVYRSHDTGATWAPLPFPGANGPYYCRSLAMDPRNPATLFAATFDADGNSVLYRTTNASDTTGNPTWEPLTLAPAGIEELIIIGNGITYVVYAACGSNGVWWSTIDHAISQAWSSLSNTPAGSPANDQWINATGGTAGDGPYWSTLSGYLDGGSHVVIAFCDNPNVPTGSQQPRSLVQFTFDTSSHLVTAWADLTSAAALSVNGVPLTESTWWHAGSNYKNWLGGGAWVNAAIAIDTTASPPAIYATGANGFYRTYDGGKTWDMAINGMAIFSARSVAVAPGNPEHIVFGDSDWCSWDLTLPAAITTTPVPPPPSPPSGYNGPEGYALAIDPDPTSGDGSGTVFLSAGQKYANAYGSVWSRNADQTASTAWTDTGLGAAVKKAYAGNASVTVGLAAGRTNPGNALYVVAAVEEGGVWRYAGSPQTWTQVSSSISLGSQPTSSMAVAVPPPASASQNVYLLDRQAGAVYRGASYGQTWTQLPNGTGLWSFPPVQDERTGFLALNPTVTATDELWAAIEGQLWKIANAGSSKPVYTLIASPGGKAVFPASPGALAFTPDGTLYCLSLATAPGSATGGPATALVRSVNTATAGSTPAWVDVSGPDAPGIAASASRPQNMAIGSDGHIYIANNANVVTQGYPAAGWTALGSSLHSGADEYTSAAFQAVTTTAPVTATGVITGGQWLMIAVALAT